MASKPSKPTALNEFITKSKEISPSMALSKEYKRLKTNFKILLGDYSEAHGKFGISSRGKQSPATCIVSVVYHKAHPVRQWTKQDLHRILDIGDKLYWTSVTRIPLKSWQRLKPHCVHPIIYIDQYKSTIFVGNDVITGAHTKEHPNLQNILAKAKTQLDDDIDTDKHAALILDYDDKHFSIWKHHGMLYLFCPHDASKDGLPARTTCGKCFVICTDSIEKLAEHLGCFINGRFTIYSMRILKFMEVKSNVAGLIEQLTQSQMPEEIATVEPEPNKDNDVVQEVVIPSGYTKDVENIKTQLSLVNHSQYRKQNDYQGSIVHSEFEEDPDMVIFDNLAAILMLHQKRASSWKSDTIAEILALGNEISENEIDVDTHIAGYFEAEAFDKTYKLEFEKIVFGQVTSTDKNVPTIETGVQMFFQNYNIGLIDGPQIVAIWREKNLYFSFDPKERDELGRKWTKFLANRNAGGACVLYHTDMKHLIDTYIANVPVKHRKDSFRIIHVKVIEAPEDDDWEEWKTVRTGVHSLQGVDALCKYLTEKEANKLGKSLSVALYTLAFLSETPEDEWDEQTLDSILKNGIAFFNSMEPKENTLANIKKLVSIGEKKILLIVDECVVSQKDVADLKGMAAIKSALQKFFHDCRAGILNCCDSILVIWQSEGAYYALDFSEKHNISQALESIASIPGKITALRFEKFTEFINVISRNPKYLGCANICISSVGVSSEEGRDVPLRNYAALEENGAILFHSGFHEGLSMFGTRADNQTLMNLITALCLTTINNAADWSKVDLVDIIRIGDRMYQNFIQKLDECGAYRRELNFGDVEPKIGLTTFTFTTKETKGILNNESKHKTEATTEKTPPETNKEKEKSTTGDENKVDSKSSKEPKQDPETSKESPAEDETHRTAKTILQNIDKENKDFFAVTLKNDFCQISIWKQDKLYFVFDPKANDEKGYPSPRRIQRAEVQITERKKAAEREAEKLKQSISETKDAETNKKPDTESSKETPSEAKKQSKSEVANDNEKPKDETTETKTKEPEKEPVDLMTLSNDGSAYVAWFQTLVALIDHIVSKVPDQYFNNPITVNTVQITKNITDFSQSSLGNYEQRSEKGFGILRGLISQDDPLLPNRNYIDAACSIVAFAFLLISPADKWQQAILDVILKYGDRLYSKSLSLNGELDERLKLTIDKIAKSFSIYQQKFDYEIQPIAGEFSLNNPSQFAEINPAFDEKLKKFGVSNETNGYIPS